MCAKFQACGTYICTGVCGMATTTGHLDVFTVFLTVMLKGKFVA